MQYNNYQLKQNWILQLNQIENYQIQIGNFTSFFSNY